MKRYTLAAVFLLLVAATGCGSRARRTPNRRSEDDLVVIIRQKDPRRDHIIDGGIIIPPMLVFPRFDPPAVVLPPEKVVTPAPNPGLRLEPLKISKAGWAPKGRRTWRYIVIHHSATSAGNADRFHRNHRDVRGWVNGLGYNFVIGNGNGSGDGQVEVGPRWRRQIDGAHAGSEKYNKYGIGICLVGNFDVSRPSERQWRALVELVHFMQKRYKIRNARIKLHQDIRRGSTHCPGNNFDVDKFHRYLRARRGSD